MSALERPFINAIDAGQIEGVLMEGRSKAGKKYSKALGKRTLPDGTTKTLSSSDLTFLASSTKLLTTIAALQSCERGQLSLDADVTDRFSAINDLGVLIDWDESTNSPKSECLRKPITLRRLLTHSSGLAYEFATPKLQKWRAANPSAEDATGVQAQWPAPLDFQPGEGWMYGTGIDWAGVLVEQATGLRLDECFRKHISHPLGISAADISFFPVREGQGDRMPDLSPKDPKGLGLSASMGMSLHDEGTDAACYGGGGAYASAEAYITVLHSLLANDGKILSLQSVTEMLKPQLESKAKDDLASKFQSQWGPFFDMGTTTSNRDYGLGGLLVTEDGDGSGMGRGSLTWGGGINSAWFIDPTNEICGFVSPQLGIPADPVKARELKAVFRKQLKGELGSEAS